MQMGSGDRGDPEEVVMTPLRYAGQTTLRCERLRRSQRDPGKEAHMAGGQHIGLVVQRAIMLDHPPSDMPEMQLEFKCRVTNASTGAQLIESRSLKFWFLGGTQQYDRMNSSYDFFREILKNFPKDYAGFTKKVMHQLMDDRYTLIIRIDVSVIPLNMSQDQLITHVEKEDHRTQEEIIQQILSVSDFGLQVKRPKPSILEQLFTTIEEAFPTVLSVEDLMRILEVDQITVEMTIEELMAQDRIRRVEHRNQTRVGSPDLTDPQVGFLLQVEGGDVGNHADSAAAQVGLGVVQEIKEQSEFRKIVANEKPTVALITNLMCEKRAVDSMLQNKTTYVRYETKGGESHVYTIGQIGNVKVVSTKLPMVGNDMKAKISSANTTTRLFGAFQDLEHTLLVGIGGSVPHFTDFDKHSRLGDVVVSAPLGEGADAYMYIFCEKAEPNEDGVVEFALRRWTARDLSMLRVVENLLNEFEADPEHCVWARYLDSASDALVASGAADYQKPGAETDRLQLPLGDGQVVEVGHPPCPPETAHLYQEGVPAVRLGALGSGRSVFQSDQIRNEFAAMHHLLAYDADYDQVLAALKGSGCDSFLFVRGMADYSADGSKGKDWQAYAALASAAFAKCIVLKMQ